MDFLENLLLFLLRLFVDQRGQGRLLTNAAQAISALPP